MANNFSCDHDFIQLSPDNLHPGFKAICHIEWCTKCGRIKIVRQRGKSLLYSRDPSRDYSVGSFSNVEPGEIKEIST